MSEPDKISLRTESLEPHGTPTSGDLGTKILKEFGYVECPSWGARRTRNFRLDFEVSGGMASEVSNLDDLSSLTKAEAALGDGAVWLAAQMEAFQAAVRGAPLDVALGILARAAANQ